MANEKSPSASQALLAERASRYLAEHMDSRVTLSELSGVFHVSGTHIKNSFKSVYGLPVYTYLREQKMRAAAETLRTSNLTVLEVAGRYGYDNGSKFARAFREVIGVPPREYRSRHRRGQAKRPRPAQVPA